MSVKSLLREEIESQMSTLDDIPYGSDEYKSAVDCLAKLLDKYNDMEKTDLDYQDKLETRKEDNELKLKQIKQDNIHHIVGNVLTGVSVVGGFLITIWGTKASFEFEKEGTITTIMGRGFIGKLLPKK